MVTRRRKLKEDKRAEDDLEEQNKQIISWIELNAIMARQKTETNENGS